MNISCLQLDRVEHDEAEWRGADLEQVREIDEHVRRLLHPAGRVQARRDDVLGPAALGEVHVYGEVEVALAGVCEAIGESERGRQVLDPPLPCNRNGKDQLCVR